MHSALREGLLAAAACRTVADLGSAVCAALARPSAVLARIWLADPAGDLRLLASAGSPLGGGSYRRIDGIFASIARGTGKIGRVAATREPFIVRQLRGDEEWLVNPEWIARQNVRSFAAHPLVAGDELLGVLARFDRVIATDEALDDLGFLADYTAVRLVTLREPAAPPTPPTPPPPGIVTRAALRDLERRSIQAALASTGGKVFGLDGAAARLAMKPTTLASRIKALGIVDEST